MRTTPTWRLQGSTDKVAECFIEAKSASLHAVTIVFGRETLLDELYPDAASAAARAVQVRDRLLNTGDWTSTTGGAVARESPRSRVRGAGR